MCGRITLTTSGGEELARLLEAELDPADAAVYKPRYNVAPTDQHWIARVAEGKRVLVPARWGVPTARRLAINARAETVGRAPDFREAWQTRRCIVASDGFYEWKGPPKARRPIWFHAREPGALVLLAGVFEELPAGEDAGEARRAPVFTILTTRANELVAPVHDRMPVVLSREQAAAYLAAPDRELLAPAPPDALVATEVSPRANSVAHDDPACLEPPPAEGPKQFSMF